MLRYSNLNHLSELTHHSFQLHHADKTGDLIMNINTAV